MAHADFALPSNAFAHAKKTTPYGGCTASWHIDFVASGHMTGNPSLFCNFNVFSAPQNIILADGRSSPAF